MMGFEPEVAEGRHRRLRRCQRGATLVEYALGISLIAIASIGAISFLEDSGSDALSDKGSSIGGPDLSESATPPPPPVADDGGDDDSDTTPSDVTVDASVISSANPQHGNTWDAQVVLSITDQANPGTPVDGATIFVTWTKLPDNVTVTASCTTQADGQCTFQLSDMERRTGKTGFVGSVQLTVTGIQGDGFTITYSPLTPLTVAVSNPNPSAT